MSPRRRLLQAAIFAVAVAALAAIWYPASMSAGSATANLTVNASVVNNCTIGTAPLTFVGYDPIVAHATVPMDTTGTVTITCTKGAPTTIGLDTGANASGSVRRLVDGSSNYLTYELYSEGGRTTVWGNTSGTWLAPGAPTSKAARPFTVYGRVGAGQDVPAGNYSDTVIATVNF